MITDPIDLSTMGRKLRKGAYSVLNGGMRAFRADLDRMFENCRVFNGEDSHWYKEAKKLSEASEAILKDVERRIEQIASGQSADKDAARDWVERRDRLF